MTDMWAIVNVINRSSYVKFGWSGGHSVGIVSENGFRGEKEALIWLQVYKTPRNLQRICKVRREPQTKQVDPDCPNLITIYPPKNLITLKNAIDLPVAGLKLNKPIPAEPTTTQHCYYHPPLPLFITHPVRYTISRMSIGYDMAYLAVALVSSPVWGYRLLRTGKWRTDWPGRLGCARMIPDCDKPKRILIHAVSVGEVNAIRQLVSALSEADDGLQIIISTTTDTGYARACSLFDHVVRYPLDFTRAVRKFLDRVKPDLVALVELEVWPNFVNECQRRNVPVCVVNGRLSEKSYRHYQLVKPFVRGAFSQLDAAAVQTSDYATRFQLLGTATDRIHVLDTMKWDTAQITDYVDGQDELAKSMGIDRNRPLIVAGSTGPGEEQMLIEQIPADVQLMLVPRKPERFDEVARLAPMMVRRSHWPDGGNVRPVDNTSTLLLLDTMGELRKAYSLANVVIVGRSYNGLGGSDPIESIALGKPTIIGPDHHNFTDVVGAFADENGIIVTDQPGQAAAKLIASPDMAAELAGRGRNVIISRQGATNKHRDLIRQVLTYKTNRTSVNT